jgi:hypothetical protein
VEVKEEEEVPQADFNKMMETYLADLAKKMRRAGLKMLALGPKVMV